MQSHSQEAMFGFPAVRIRQLVQRWGWGPGGVELVREVMEISESAAGELLEVLIHQGLVQKCPEPPASPGWDYELTVEGTSIGAGDSTASLRRETVRVRLHELIERMSQVNRDERFFVGVQEASVTGAYLSGADRVPQLDVQYTTYRKIVERREFARVTERAARASGRRFSNDLGLRLWPEDEVKDHLQSGSRLYSLSSNSERRRDEQTPRLVVFRDRAPVPGWRDL